MKRVLIFLLIVVLIVVIVYFLFYRKPQDQLETAFTLPEEPGLPVLLKNDTSIIEHMFYTLSYNEKYAQANWVYYKLEAKNLAIAGHERGDDFRSDPLVATESASVKDYKGSGFDRGHLLPAADMAWSEEAMSETFFMSNMSPQAPSFNRGIWKKLETLVREWALIDTTLFVVTGPVLKDGLPVIGENQVSVPKLFYKVILDYHAPEYKGIGFVMGNSKLPGEVIEYAVTIDSVESLTGIDFFHELPDDFEAQIESSKNLFKWHFENVTNEYQ